jgi:hypothetical protein
MYVPAAVPAHSYLELSLCAHSMNTPPDQFATLHLQPNKVANRVFTPLVSSLLGGSLECMKLLIQVQTLLVF